MLVGSIIAIGSWSVILHTRDDCWSMDFADTVVAGLSQWVMIGSWCVCAQKLTGAQCCPANHGRERETYGGCLSDERCVTLASHLSLSI